MSHRVPPFSDLNESIAFPSEVTKNGQAHSPPSANVRNHSPVAPSRSATGALCPIAVTTFLPSSANCAAGKAHSYHRDFSDCSQIIFGEALTSNTRTRLET